MCPTQGSCGRLPPCRVPLDGAVASSVFELDVAIIVLMSQESVDTVRIFDPEWSRTPSEPNSPIVCPAAPKRRRRRLRRVLSLREELGLGSDSPTFRGVVPEFVLTSNDSSSDDSVRAQFDACVAFASGYGPDSICPGWMDKLHFDWLCSLALSKECGSYREVAAWAAFYRRQVISSPPAGSKQA